PARKPKNPGPGQTARLPDSGSLGQAAPEDLYYTSPRPVQPVLAVVIRLLKEHSVRLDALEERLECLYLDTRPGGLPKSYLESRFRHPSARHPALRGLQHSDEPTSSGPAEVGAQRPSGPPSSGSRRQVKATGSLKSASAPAPERSRCLQDWELEIAKL